LAPPLSRSIHLGAVYAFVVLRVVLLDDFFPNSILAGSLLSHGFFSVAMPRASRLVGSYF